MFSVVVVPFIRQLSFLLLFCNFCSSDNVRFCAKVSYEGTKFWGWQYQPSKRTVQGVLNQAMSEILKRNIFVTGASRTDKGVHAKGQIFHFDMCEEYEDLNDICNQMNALLPHDVRVFDVRRAPNGTPEQVQKGQLWHALYNAISKQYSYQFSTAPVISPLIRNSCAQIFRYDKPFRNDLFDECLSLFEGSHDFKSFSNKYDHRTQIFEEYSGQNKSDFSSIRTIFSCKTYKVNPSTSILTEDANIYRVDFHLDGALYCMIRNIIGACISVGYEKLTISQIYSYLVDCTSRHDTNIITAPACGLTLEKIIF